MKILAFQIVLALFLPFVIPLIKFSTKDFDEPTVDAGQEEGEGDIGSKTDINQVTYKLKCQGPQRMFLTFIL